MLDDQRRFILRLARGYGVDGAVRARRSGLRTTPACPLDWPAQRVTARRLMVSANIGNIRPG